eukprot:gb/GEZN01035304.1/.p1 GENE.gb/GEZN01035304.1/~~gb/GEZN01035304.1/.p1  ORF type:complete len:115 (+),score=27.22 gb/GEZN01035304.1/:33-377(+)
MSSADFVSWKKDQAEKEAAAAAAAPQKRTHSFVLRIKFSSAEEATVIQRSLEIDEEIRPDRITRVLTREGTATLVYTFNAAELRFLRVAVSSHLDMLKLASRTLAEFGPVVTSQ